MSDISADLHDTIDDLIADRFGVNQDEFTDSARLDGETLDADSLDIVELAEAIDATLGVYIPDEDLEMLETVGDVKAYVRDVV